MFGRKRLKESDSPTADYLKKYDLKVFEDKYGNYYVASKEGEILTDGWKHTFEAPVIISDDSALVLGKSSYYLKMKGKSLQKLNSIESYYVCKIIADIGVLFSNKKVWYWEYDVEQAKAESYKFVNMVTGKVEEFPAFSGNYVNFVFKPLKGLETKNVNAEGEKDYYQYVYLYHDKWEVSNFFEAPFQEKKGCQINRKKGEKGWRMYHISAEYGMVEGYDTWEELLPIVAGGVPFEFVGVNENDEYFLVKELSEEQVESNDLRNKKVKIPGKRISYAGMQINNTVFYKITGGMKTYICIFVEGELKIVSEVNAEDVTLAPIWEKGELVKEQEMKVKIMPKN